MRTLFAFLIAAGAVAAPVTAQAAPCAGFTDVEDSSPFCPSVQWMKNRNITTGCTATEYCPSSPVSRLAMAAFMNRLGGALLPQIFQTEQQLFNVDMTLGAYACLTTPILPAVPYTRFARFAVDIGAAATQNLALFFADPVVSFDGGATFLVTRQTSGYLPTGVSAISGSVMSGTVVVPPSVTPIFGLYVYRSASTTANFLSLECFLRGDLTSSSTP